MKTRTLFASLFVASVAVISAPPVQAMDMAAVFDAFYSVDLEPAGVEIQEVVLERPDMTLTLRDGIFVPAKPIEGVVTGGVFVGKGEVTFRPSQRMNREVLNLRMREWLGRSGEEYKGTFEHLVLRFDDETLAELGVAEPRESLPEEAGKLWKERNEKLDNIQALLGFGSPWNLEMDFLEKVANQSAGRDFFVAEFESETDGWLMYVYNESTVEEIFFGKHYTQGALELTHPFCVTNVKEDYSAEGAYVVPRVQEDKLAFDTEHYRQTITIPDTSRFTVDSSIDITPRTPRRTIRFDLVNNVRLDGTAKWSDRGRPVDVQKVVDATGNELQFLHRRHQIVIRFPEVLPANQATTIGVSLLEKTIIQLTPASYWVVNTYPWFPQSGFVGGRNTHEWVVKTDKKLTAVVSGKLVREWEEDDLACTGWIMEEEVQFPSLIFGEFVSKEDTYVSPLTGEEVALRVYANPSLIMNGINFGGVDKMEPVLNWAKGILEFMEGIFGPYPFDYLNIAQMAPNVGFGQAPPGLVQLTGEAFISQALLATLSTGGESDFFHGFFSHELAHQWWGHGVWGDSFRDAWLSESFAEHAAGLYVQAYLGRNRFQDKLKGWRQSANQAESSAPLANLLSLSGEMAGQNYTGLIYNKGPYVVHMLYMQMGHEKFVEGMKAFFKENLHTNVRTEALQEKMEQAAGYKLDFFFEQWWKGMGIPAYEFDYDIQPTEDGRFLFTGNLVQTSEKAYKFMLPLIFHFGKNEVSVQNRPILKAEETIQFFLPKMPARVEVDEFNTLLADQTAGKKGKKS